MHLNNILIYIQQDATLHRLFISGNYSTCFGWYLHPSSGARTTVSTASAICRAVTDTCRYRGRVGTGLSVLWVAYATHRNLQPPFSGQNTRDSSSLNNNENVVWWQSRVEFAHCLWPLARNPISFEVFHLSLSSFGLRNELEQVWVCCGWLTPPTTHSKQFQLFPYSKWWEWQVNTSKLIGFLAKGHGQCTNSTRDCHQTTFLL
jgi:hypothetical protein